MGMELGVIDSDASFIRVLRSPCVVEDIPSAFDDIGADPSPGGEEVLGHHSACRLGPLGMMVVEPPEPAGIAFQNPEHTSIERLKPIRATGGE